MQLEQKGRRLCVLLVYSITITLPPMSRCDHLQPRSHLSRSNDTNRVLTTRHEIRSPIGERSLDPRPRLRDPHRADGTDRTRIGAAGRRPPRPLEHTPAPATDGGSKHRETSTQRERPGIHASPRPLVEVCSRGVVTPVFQGSFYITSGLEADMPQVVDQSDAVASAQEGIRGQQLRGSEIWKRLHPAVGCGDHAMSLTVRRRRAAQLLLHRMNDSSVPLSQLPPECGYSVQTTWRDLRLMAQYDACHVTQEDGGYVLPLLWRGTPVKMSCPASRVQSQAVDRPSVCCSPYGMSVRVPGPSASEVLSVNVAGEWSPLVVLAEQCGYTVERRDADVVIAAAFLTCGIAVKGGKYTLSLRIGEETFTLSCPLSPSEEIPLAHQPLAHIPLPLTSGPVEQMPVSLEPLPWAPPFYLAPLYYPHPTYRYKYPSPDGHDSYKPPTPSSSTPDPTFGPQPLPLVDSQPDDWGYYSQIPVREAYKHLTVHSSLLSTDDLEDSSKVLQRKQDAPMLVLPEKSSATLPSDSHHSIHAGAAPLQPPSHAFSQYYHYYHHPKIPLPDAHQDPDPRPEVPPLTDPPPSEASLLPPSVQQSVRFNWNQLFPAVPQPYPLPTTAPYLQQPSAPPFFPHFPHFARHETRNPAATAKTDWSDQQSTHSSAVADLVPHSSEVHDKYSLDPYIGEPNPDESIHFKRHLSEDGVKEELEPPGTEAEQSSFPPPPPNHNPPPHAYYYPPYYHYYHMFYGPQRFLSTGSRVSPTSSKEASDPLPQASSTPPQHPSHHTPQTAAPPSKSMYGAYPGLLHPYYYYYHLYYQPDVSVDNQEVQTAENINSSQLPADSDFSQTLVHAAEAGHPNMPQSGPFQSLYPHEETQKHLYNPFGNSDGEEAGKRLNNELMDCAAGHHFIFVVPESAVEPAVASPGQDSHAPCTSQRLTSDPDVYIVPLDGCGVNKHMFCQTVAHLMDVYGVPSIQDDRAGHENSPLGLMMGCSLPPGSPEEVRLRVVDQPPLPPVQSTSATTSVQLRVATDESFTSLHPEAHLPLSFIRGKPVYMEVSLLDPPEPDLVLLVHSCLAYTPAPFSWMLVYDGCSSRDDSLLLPSPHTDLIQRIVISSFLSPPPESPTYTSDAGYSDLTDPEVFFLCLTEVCSSADGDCSVNCINSKFNSGNRQEKLSGPII